MTLGRRRKTPLSELGAQPRCGVAVCLREGAQAGARRSGGSRLHNVGQITRRLSDVHHCLLVVVYFEQTNDDDIRL